MKEIFEEKAWRYVVLILFFGVVVISFYLLLAPLKVFAFSVTGGIESAELRNQIVTFRFNNPVDPDEIDIEVVPDTDFELRVAGNILRILFTDSLKSNTEYKISFTETFNDIYGKRLVDSSQFIFTTRAQEFYAIEDIGENDQLIRTGLTNSNKEVLLTAPEITSFDVLSEGFVASIKREDTSQYVSIFWRGNEARLFNDSPHIIRSISYSRPLETVYILAQEARFKEDIDFLLPEGDTNLYSYKLNSSDLLQVTVPEAIEEPTEIEVSPDGFSLLIKDIIDSNYFLINPFSNEGAVPLGRFSDFSDISNKRELLFTAFDLTGGGNYPFVALVSTEKEITKVTDSSIYSIDPKFINSSTIIYSQQVEDIINTKGRFAAFIKDLKTDEITKLELEDYSVELAKVSPGSEYILFEAFKREDLLTDTSTRVEEGQPRGLNQELLLYSIESEEFTLLDLQARKIQWR